MPIADDFWKTPTTVDPGLEAAKATRRALRCQLNAAIVDSLITGEPKKRLHAELDKILADTADVSQA